MWTLVERWEPSTAASTKTFSGLDGNTDRRYKIVGSILAPAGLTAGDVLFTYNTDTTATNYRTQRAGGYDATSHASVDTTVQGHALFHATSSQVSMFDFTIFAKSGMARQLSGIGYFDYTGSSLQAFSKYGLWNNTTDNITQIVLTFGGGNLFTSTCYIELWKLSE
jgi:acyl-CoA thioesterase